MKSWSYTINLKEIWSKYQDYDHESYDENKELFSQMKVELTDAIQKQLRPGDVETFKPVLTSLRKSNQLSSFNKHWNTLYDYCDFKRIWLATNF